MAELNGRAVCGDVVDRVDVLTSEIGIPVQDAAAVAVAHVT